MKKTLKKAFMQRDIDIGEKITLENISFLKPLPRFTLLIIKKFSIKS